MKNLIKALAVMLAITPTAGPAEPAFDIAKVFPEINCMALNVYYEARGSSLADQAAVADVVLNRVKDTRYPDTVCDVVKQGLKDASGNMRRNKCQFSWYCDGKSDNPQDQDRWAEAQMIAWNIVTDGKYRGLTEGSTHYHATYVNPRWASSLQLVGRIGAHIFYRWE
jgi:spore germination cell wall hydrolase CwlJ-like protein|tara:strand:- start:4184 stop:4684 length:501 start_codon:yes stop_codon:yes gene_type:complete